jgi:DNA-binding IclR family transcriptional regulator
MAEKKTGVETTTTSFEILSTLHRAQPATLTEVADLLDLPRSTVYYHLDTLHDLGFLMREDDQYILSLRFLELGESARQQLPIYEVGKPEVENLAAETDTNGYLMVEQNDVGVIAYLRKENDIHLGDSVGQPVHLTSTAMGKAFLSQLPEDRVVEIVDHHGLPEITSNTITNRGDLLAELETIRDRGYAVSKGEQVEGLYAIGAPVLGPEGEVYGAISISAPKQHMTDELLEETYPEKVLSTANVVELKLVGQVST